MNVRNIVVYALLLAVVDALMAIFLKDRLGETSVILGLVFINLSMVALIVFTEVYPKTVNSYVYSLSASMFSATFFVLELIVAILIIVIDGNLSQPWQHTVCYCVQPIMFVLYIIVMIFNTSINYASGKEDIKTAKRRREFTLVLYPTMQKAFDLSKNMGCFKTVEKAYDEVRSLPTDSVPESKQVDDELIALANELVSAAEGKNEDSAVAVCAKIMDAANRKRTILAGKN